MLLQSGVIRVSTHVLGSREDENSKREGYLHDLQYLRREGQTCQFCNRGTLKMSKAGKLYCSNLCWTKRENGYAK